MAVNSVGNLSRGTSRSETGASQSAKRSSVVLNVDERSRLESQDSVNVPSTEKQRQQGLATALRSLSTAQSVVDTASVATARAGEVLRSSLAITDKLKVEVDPTKREALANEGAALIEEIDRIESEATAPNGESVFNRGAVSVELSLKSADDNSGDRATLLIPDLQLSRQSLGVDSITASTLASQTEEDADTIEQAISIVANVSSALDSADSAISSAAEKFGISESQLGARPSDQEATDIANRITKSISEADIVQQASRLDPLRVSDLLAAPEEEDTSDPEKSNQLQATGADSNS